MIVDEIMKSEKLKERFCKDCNIPIRIFKEPYFFERLVLYDAFYGTLDKWKLFCRELDSWRYENEQDYFEEYNRLKDKVIDFIKNSHSYETFNKLDMNKFVVDSDITSRDIYHPDNDNHIFISIDMKQANYSSLLHFDESIFDYNSWESFLRKFTYNEHIITSKYIRQVILGNCNPCRQVTYEKYLMNQVLTEITEKKQYIDQKYVVSFSNDEIVIDVTDYSLIHSLYSKIYWFCDNYHLPLKAELFKLKRIKGIKGYMQDPIPTTVSDGQFKFKGLDSNTLPLVIRKLRNEEITENDLVFVHDGALAKWIDVPEIEV